MLAPARPAKIHAGSMSMESVATLNDVLALMLIALACGIGIGVMVGGELERRRRK
jgi:hypothetical protein